MTGREVISTPKVPEVSNQELIKLTDIYKELNPPNRSLATTFAGLILAGQQNDKDTEKQEVV